MDQELLKWAVHLHGHLGPFLVLGLMAGEEATRRLGRDPLKSKAVVLCKPRPPRSCFADGVQLTTGCTLGKGNIEISDSDGISLIYHLKGKKVKVSMKKDVLEELEAKMEREGLEELSEWVMKIDPFIVEE